VARLGGDEFAVLLTDQFGRGRSETLPQGGRVGLGTLRGALAEGWLAPAAPIADAVRVTQGAGVPGARSGPTSTVPELQETSPETTTNNCVESPGTATCSAFASGHVVSPSVGTSDQKMANWEAAPGGSTDVDGPAKLPATPPPATSLVGSGAPPPSSSCTVT
jgi:hypothetical protein